jgi:hypothetical protein
MAIIELKPKAPKIAWFLTDIADMFFYNGYPFGDTELPDDFDPCLAFLEEEFVCQLIDTKYVTIYQSASVGIEPYKPWQWDKLLKYINTDHFFFKENITKKMMIIGIVDGESYRRYLIKDIDLVFSFAKKYCKFDKFVAPFRDREIDISDFDKIIENVTFNPSYSIKNKFINKLLQHLNKIPSKGCVKELVS